MPGVRRDFVLGVNVSPPAGEGRMAVGPWWLRCHRPLQILVYDRKLESREDIYFMPPSAIKSPCQVFF